MYNLGDDTNVYFGISNLYINITNNTYRYTLQIIYKSANFQTFGSKFKFGSNSENIENNIENTHHHSS